MSSSSRSASSQNIYQYDNRNVLGEGSINAQGGSSVTVNTLDADVINRALAANGLTIENAFSFGSEAFDMGAGALRQSFDFGGEALAFADATNARASRQISEAASDALAVGSNSLDKAFAFGSNSMDRAFGTLVDSQNMVATAYADAKGRGALTDKILIGAIAAVAFVAYAAVGKK